MPSVDGDYLWQCAERDHLGFGLNSWTGLVRSLSTFPDQPESELIA